MKRFLFPAGVVLALAIAGGTTYKAVADTAQAATPDMGQQDDGAGPPGGPPPWGQHRSCGGPGGWDQSGKGGPGLGQWKDKKFSLFAPVKDKALSDTDVKTIASALLLEHGNHDWSVSNVTDQPDKSIRFSFATSHGDVVATFAIDPASGRIKRVS